MVLVRLPHFVGKDVPFERLDTLGDGHTLLPVAVAVLLGTLRQPLSLTLGGVGADQPRTWFGVVTVSLGSRAKRAATAAVCDFRHSCSFSAG